MPEADAKNDHKSGRFTLIITVITVVGGIITALITNGYLKSDKPAAEEVSVTTAIREEDEFPVILDEILSASGTQFNLLKTNKLEVGNEDIEQFDTHLKYGSATTWIQHNIQDDVWTFEMQLYNGKDAKFASEKYRETGQKLADKLHLPQNDEADGQDVSCTFKPGDNVIVLKNIKDEADEFTVLMEIQ